MNIQAIKSIVKQNAWTEVDKFIREETGKDYIAYEGATDAVIARGYLARQETMQQVRSVLAKLHSLATEPEGSKETFK